MAKDPVCGMEVDESTAKHKAEYEGTVYYFCCSECMEEFQKDPSKYAGKTHGAHGGHHPCC